jgi:hypothetical protein
MAEIEGAAGGIATASGNLRVHVRTQAREAVARLLKTETAAWALVYQSRIDYPRDIWPYLKVYTDREDAVRLSVHSPHVQERSLSVNVVAMIRIPSAGETESIEDKMDSIATLIETNLTETRLRTELNTLTSMDLQSSSMDVVLNTDEKISHAELTMSYLLKYRTLEGVPESYL